MQSFDFKILLVLRDLSSVLRTCLKKKEDLLELIPFEEKEDFFNFLVNKGILIWDIEHQLFDWNSDFVASSSLALELSVEFRSSNKEKENVVEMKETVEKPISKSIKASYQTEGYKEERLRNVLSFLKFLYGETNLEAKPLDLLSIMKARKLTNLNVIYQKIFSLKIVERSVKNNLLLIKWNKEFDPTEEVASFLIEEVNEYSREKWRVSQNKKKGITPVKEESKKVVVPRVKISETSSVESKKEEQTGLTYFEVQTKDRGEMKIYADLACLSESQSYSVLVFMKKDKEVLSILGLSSVKLLIKH